MEQPIVCQDCGAALPEGALVCSQCQRLVFARELQELRTRAEATLAVGNFESTREIYTGMLAMLPPGSSQYQAILDRLRELPLPKPEAAPPDPPWKKLVGSLGVFGAFAWKFKTFALLLFTKGKFLLFGLTKLKTLLSMFASMGLYWALYGWRFGVGFVLSIYIHEMGHMWAFRRFGIPASAPMFIPGFGAFVRAEVAILDPAQDARIGLAGPWWGLGASIIFGVLAQILDLQWMSAVSHAGAFINLFNLVPVFGLDGSHAYKVLGRQRRVMILVTMLLLWYLSGDSIFFLISLGAGYRLFTKDAPEYNDEGVFLQFITLLAAFAIVGFLTAHSGRAVAIGV